MDAVEYLMEEWFEFVRFNRAIYCEGCRRLIARRASDSVVVDEVGNLVPSEAIVLDYDPRADYRIECECGQKMELRSPEDAEQMKGTTLDHCKGPVVVRLT
jgi:hypothetical protein